MSIFLKRPLWGEDRESGFPVMIIGVIGRDVGVDVIVVDADGYMSVKPVAMVRSDARYDMKRREWYDITARTSEVELDG